MNKFLKIKCDKLELTINFPKKPIPILWNYKGFYGWIPIEIVKNEVDRVHHNEQICPGLAEKTLDFTWQQVYPLRPDVGKILEKLDKQNKEMLIDLAIVHEDTNLADSNKLDTFIEHNKMIRNRTKKYENLRLCWHA